MYEKNKFLIWSVVILIILNIGSLGFLWYKQALRPAQPPTPLDSQINPDKFLETELRLTADQIDAFHALRRKHQEATAAMRHDIHKFSKDIVDELYKSHPDTARVTALAEAIGRKQAEFERALYDHFSNLKSICNADQQDRLHGLLFEFLDRTKLDRPPQSPENRRDDQVDMKRPARPDDKAGGPPPRRDDNSEQQPPPRQDDNSGRQPPPRQDDQPGKQPRPRQENSPERR